MKTCTKCGEEKPGGEFHKRSRGKDGLRSCCKVCNIAAVAYWQRANPEKVAAMIARWRKKNPEKAAAIIARYQKANSQKCTAAVSARRARKLQATPGWADLESIQTVYEAAASLTRGFGMDYHVDHIVPLRSKLVCGLHVRDNLRVIDAKANRRKSNKHWPDMPG